jgi:hypothetical protein
MGKYHTKNGVDWVQIVPRKNSQEIFLLLKNPKRTSEEEQIINKWQDSAFVEVESNMSDELIGVYNSIKPIEDFELISVDLFKKESKVYSGIMNYRVNQEHKQIRF